MTDKTADQNRQFLTRLANLGIATHRLDQIRDAARLHRQQLIGTSELYAVIEAMDDEVQPPTDQTAEEHRLALSEALGLGTGAPWDAIHDRATELGLPPLDRDPVARRLGLLPAPTDQTALLLAAVDRIGSMPEASAPPLSKGVTWTLSELRRLAGEAQQDEARAVRCPHGCDTTHCPCLACEAEQDARVARQDPAQDGEAKLPPMDPAHILGIDAERDDPTQCSGEEGFCPEHGFHRHSLKQDPTAVARSGQPETD